MNLKNLGLMVLILTVLFSFNFQPVLAKDATPAASLTPIQQKLENLKQEIASKAAQIKSEISQKISNKAYAGVISQIQDQPHATASAKLITLTTSKGNKVVSVNDFTIYQDSSNPKKAMTVKNFSQGDYVAALGDVDDNQLLTAKKLIKAKPPKVDTNQALWGQIQSVGTGTILLVNRDNKKINLAVDNADFRVASDEATLRDVIPGNFLISLGTAVQNNRSVSDFIYLINPNGDLKIHVATPSASPSASASATPKKK